MAYDPTKDFLALWRNIAGVVSKTEMPGMDYVVAALARAGLISVSVSATAPVVAQSTTAWLKEAVPSYSAEGQLFLWDKVTTTYLAATPALLLQLLEAWAGENGVSWWTAAGGAPINTVGNNGDFAVRTDAPYGIYGPKALGAWPASPIPGTADVVTSASLDNTFGGTPGQIIVRGAGAWAALPIGAEDMVLTVLGGLPAWDAVSALLDVVFSNARGSMLYRGAGAWAALAAGVATQVLTTGGVGADPSWQPRTAEFPSGTSMVFYQAAAPTGWTKQVAVSDCGLRVTSGSGGVFTAGSAFSAVFAQTVVGNTTLSVSQMPSHAHPGSNVNSNNASSGVTGGTNPVTSGAAGTIASQGGGTAHAHSVNLTLAYVDVIIASKN